MPGTGFNEVLKAASEILVDHHGYRKRGPSFYREEPGILLNVWFQKLPVPRGLGFTINAGVGSARIAKGECDDAWASKALHARHHLNFRIASLMTLPLDKIYLYEAASVAPELLAELKSDLKLFVVPFHAEFKTEQDVLKKLMSDGCGLSPDRHAEYVRYLTGI